MVNQLTRWMEVMVADARTISFPSWSYRALTSNSRNVGGCVWGGGDQKREDTKQADRQTGTISSRQEQSSHTAEMLSVLVLDPIDMEKESNLSLSSLSQKRSKMKRTPK